MLDGEFGMRNNERGKGERTGKRQAPIFLISLREIFTIAARSGGKGFFLRFLAYSSTFLDILHTIRRNQ
jgi:hypothetical protein